MILSIIKQIQYRGCDYVTVIITDPMASGEQKQFNTALVLKPVWHELMASITHKFISRRMDKLDFFRRFPVEKLAKFF